MIFNFFQTSENLIKEAEKQEEIKEAIEKNKETIIPKIEVPEVQPKSTEGIKKSELKNGNSKTI